MGKGDKWRRIMNSGGGWWRLVGKGDKWCRMMNSSGGWWRSVEKCDEWCKLMISGGGWWERVINETSFNGFESHYVNHHAYGQLTK